MKNAIGSEAQANQSTVYDTYGPIAYENNKPIVINNCSKDPRAPLIDVYK